MGFLRQRVCLVFLLVGIELFYISFQNAIYINMNYFHNAFFLYRNLCFCGSKIFLKFSLSRFFSFFNPIVGYPVLLFILLLISFISHSPSYFFNLKLCFWSSKFVYCLLSDVRTVQVFILKLSFLFYFCSFFILLLQLKYLNR